MNKRPAAIFILLWLYSCTAAIAGNPWRHVPARQLAGSTARLPAGYLAYTAANEELQAALSDAGGIITLPMSDGGMRSFAAWSTPMLPPALAARYPQLKTYTAVATDDAAVTAKIDMTQYGFHAMVFDKGSVTLIDPAGKSNDGYYIVHSKSDEIRQQGRQMSCMVHGASLLPQAGPAPAGKATAAAISNGTELRTYRLALSCDHQYAQTVTANAAPDKGAVLSKLVTSMNRVNGIYERELAVTMVFIANEDTLIFPVAAGDPFGDYNDDATSLLFENQVICDSLVGTANYDLGHIFTTGAGGLSQLGIVCQATLKAQSVTGSSSPMGDAFDVDYVAHEMGHEFGSQHTFNDNVSAACSPNAVPECAYEPGSGSTIMCYAGICGPDNIQPHSDAYFSASSLRQMQAYITGGAGNGCAVKAPTGNAPLAVPAFAAHYTIPYLTPFELTAPAVAGTVADTQVTYCWEEADLGDFGKTLEQTHVGGPLFRSFSPVASATRIFPRREMVLAGTLSNAGVNNAMGEKAPDAARQMSFRLTVRNIAGGRGCFVMPADSITMSVINTGTGFAVTSQAVDGISYSGNTSQEVKWNVATTNAAPISTASVDIYMSADSGRTWTWHLGTFPNSGSALVTLPNPDTTIPAARFKVKGKDNVFFNVSSKDFRVDRNLESAIKIYPVPAHSVLHVVVENSGSLQAAVYSAIGRCEWRGAINGQADLPAYLWARGIYFIKLTDSQNRRVIHKFAVD